LVCSAEQRVHDLGVGFGVFASVTYWLLGDEFDEDEEDIFK